MTFNDEDYDYNDIIYNYTDNDTAPPCQLYVKKSMEIIIQTYIHSFICVFGLLGNVLVIVTYAYYKQAKTMTDVYLLNVAFADLLFVLALPLIIHNERNAWSMGHLVCKMAGGAYSINLYSSMLLLACISCDRYIAIVQARRFFGIRSRLQTYSRLICLAVWALAVTLTIPSVYYSKLTENNLPGDTSTECQMQIDDTKTAVLMKVLVPSLQVSIGFLLPLVVMLISYSSTAWTLLRAQNAQRQKALTVVLTVVVVFILCHLPYNVALLFHTVGLFKVRGCEEEQVKITTLSITRSLAYLHCCLNPFLYAFIGVKFRSHLRKILEDMWCLGKKYIYSGQSSTQISDLYILGRRSAEGSNNDNGSSFNM
ncbi:C-C chemokine receptor type 6 [Osmerus mordax]|uniref:C-C chemokine receptor type 6 n=1 Tax=Osmerus mordax TaxID=8014 RepID=UPI0035107B15